MSVKTDNTQTLVNALEEIEKLREQVSEHEEDMALFMSVAVLICKQESDEWGSDKLQTYKDYAEVCGERISKLSPVNAKAWLLRKQAEAVEGFGLRVAEGALEDENFEDGDFAAGDIQIMANSEGQRLRQQASELENGHDHS